MTQQPLTQEQALATWTALYTHIEVGAYEERSSYHHETDTWPEDGIEESLNNLETWASRQGLEFCYNHDDKTWRLVPIQQDDEEEEEIEGDGSHLHQCPYCYNLVSEEHEEFCLLNPDRNRLQEDD